MVENVSYTAKPGMIARLKVGDGAQTPAQNKASMPGLTASEHALADLLDLSDDTKTRVNEGRKVDAFLRLFSSALNFFNGFRFSSYRPVASTVEVEFVEAKNPYKLDKKI